MTIKRGKNYLFCRIAATHIVTIISLIYVKTNPIVVLTIWMLTAVFPNLIMSFTKRLKAIEINENNVCLIFSKHFKEVKETYQYEDLIFTNNIERVGKFREDFQLRIYYRKKDAKLVEFENRFGEWTQDTVIEIIRELRNKGVIIE